LEYDSHLLFEQHVQEIHQKKALKRSTSKDAPSIQKKNKLIKRESSKGIELQKIEAAILQPQQQPSTTVTRVRNAVHFSSDIKIFRIAYIYHFFSGT
jgi:hypothetical protein